MIRLDTSQTRSFLDPDARAALQPRLLAAHRQLLDGTGAGSDFLGWRTLLRRPNDALLSDIEQQAAALRHDADVLLCLGIGGSYLGAQAVIQALSPYFSTTAPRPQVLFAGHHMSGTYLRDLLASLEGRSVYVNVISKSGTTLETAIAFRFVRQWLEARFDDADRRIIVTTDPHTGVLNQLQRERGYKKYVIPPDVGGRFSVLTPVGLLPIAAAGIDVRTLFYGAVSCFERLETPDDNPALEYAATRYLLYEAGRAIETLAVFEPKLLGIGQWWQQLYGESEGKDHRGLFPAVLQYSTDLHSMGQFMQEGPRLMLETFLIVEQEGTGPTVPPSEDDLDGLEYLAGKPMAEVNRRAYEGTAAAHHAGGVPTLTLGLERLAPGPLGALLYFFEHAVAVSGYLLGVNPFDQPGVEAYKKEMFKRLGKPS